MKQIGKNFPDRVETPYNTYLRAEKVKKSLNELLSKMDGKGKIVCVGHQTIFKFMTATKWERVPGGEGNNYAVDPLVFRRLNNCEIVPFDKYLL